MSFNGGRRAPNVSQYLADLNTIPGSQSLATQQNDFGGLGDDLDFLTNTEFFDFDNFNGNVDFQQPAPQPEMSAPSVMPQQQAPQQQQKSQGNGMGMNAQYQFGEFQTYPVAPTNSLASSPPNGMQGPFPAQYQPQPSTGDKRKVSATDLPSAAAMEEQARVAAEEDKRRRNTAASARFRVKKKQREQDLEKRAKEMAEKVQQLEGKVTQLETENKWLKGLITEKSNGAVPERKSSVVEREGEERSSGERTDGVGTADDTDDVAKIDDILEV